MAQGKSYKIGINSHSYRPSFSPQPTSPLPALLGSYTSPADPTLEAKRKIMHYFTHLLLFALSPLTILAQPSHRAQTALAEENPVVQALDKAASEYLEAYELADKLPASCVFAVEECTDKLVRTLPNMIVPSLLVPPLTWRANANQKVIPVHITRANEQLDIAAENFVPKVPCASIDAAFLKVNPPLPGAGKLVDLQTGFADKLRLCVWNSCVTASRTSTQCWVASH